MALNFGKHAGIVGAIGLAITLVLGIGATKLDFATGQDSYLNKDEQVYQDNVAYQGLFGGQAMVTLFTMDEGRDVVDLFTPENIQQLQDMDEQLHAADGVETVVTPLTALQFTQNLAVSDNGDPTQSVAGQALLGASEREPDPAAQEVRAADAGTTLQRLNEVPEDQRTFENPDWVRFLLFDNRGDIRKSLRPFFPDETHAQMITRLVGNASLEDEGNASEQVQDIILAQPFEGADVTSTGAPVLLKHLNDYLRGGMLTLGAIAVGIMVVILLLLFGVRWRLLPLAVILIGLVWAFGLAGYLGIPLSVVTIAGLPVMLRATRLLPARKSPNSTVRRGRGVRERTRKVGFASRIALPGSVDHSGRRPPRWVLEGGTRRHVPGLGATPPPRRRPPLSRMRLPAGP
jgi:predicted RND superfamily exporter protein